MTAPHPDTLLLYTDPNFRQPSPDDVRAVYAMLGYTGNRIAGLTGVKDGRAVRRWLAPVTARSHATIDYAAWRLLLLEAALVQAPKRPRKPGKTADRSEAGNSK
jgi:hypothetical protein